MGPFTLIFSSEDVRTSELKLRSEASPHLSEGVRTSELKLRSEASPHISEGVRVVSST